MSSFDKELIECFVTEASDALTTWEKVCIEISPENVEQSLNAIFRVAHNLKGSSRSIGLEHLGQFVHEVEDHITTLKQNLSLVTESQVQRLLQIQTFLVQWFAVLNTDPSHKPDTERALAILKSTDTGPARELQNMTQVDPVAPKKATANETIRVRSQKLDQLIQVIGELGIQQAIVSHCVKENKFSSADFQKAINMVTKMSKEIQTQAIGLRMLELQNLFQRLERTGKEVSSSINKKIDFTVIGSELELDKAVIETITEPLIHIIRNAVDHGVESSEARVAAGKPATAKVSIRAFKETDAVYIAIEDDGKGLNADKIRAKALEKGLIQETTTLSPNDIYNLIFLPGFSTADQVTSVSGRGVGMDVVRQAVDSVGGRVDIKSKAGVGSTFTMILPTSMNIIDSIVVEVGQERLVLPLNNVNEIIDLSSNEITDKKDAEGNVLQLRGQLIPLEALSSFLKFSNSRSKMSLGTQNPVIISSSANGSVAFRVDRVVGQQRIIVKSINGRTKYPPYVSGATVLSDGRPGIIVALSTLASDICQSHRNVKEAQ